MTDLEAEKFNASMPDFFSEGYERGNSQDAINSYAIGSLGSIFSFIIATKVYYYKFKGQARTLPIPPIAFLFFMLSQYCGV